MTREELLERYEDLLFADGYDAAIQGVALRAGNPVVVYSYEKVIEILAETMTEEEAIEFFDFNIGGAYVGEETPVFLL
jgi:hypothetical protein